MEHFDKTERAGSMRGRACGAGLSVLLLILAGLAIVALVVPLAANYAGVCVGQLRRLDRDEQQQRVYDFLKARNRLTLRGVDGSIEGIEDRGFAYPTYEAFESANPLCCTFPRTGPQNLSLPLDMRFRGLRRSFVRVEYREAHDGSKPTTRMKTDFLVISNCGEVDDNIP